MPYFDQMPVHSIIMIFIQSSLLSKAAEHCKQIKRLTAGSMKKNCFQWGCRGIGIIPALFFTSSENGASAQTCTNSIIHLFKICLVISKYLSQNTIQAVRGTDNSTFPHFRGQVLDSESLTARISLSSSSHLLSHFISFFSKTMRVESTFLDFEENVHFHTLEERVH